MCSRSTFPDSPLILYDQTLLCCFHFCSHLSEAEKSPPSTPSLLAICLAFPCKIGPLIGYPLARAVANHLHKITLTSLCLTIIGLDKERLLYASFSIFLNSLDCSFGNAELINNSFDVMSLIKMLDDGPFHI